MLALYVKYLMLYVSVAKRNSLRKKQPTAYKEVEIKTLYSHSERN
jgi:hypothetical protein